MIPFSLVTDPSSNLDCFFPSRSLRAQDGLVFPFTLYKDPFKKWIIGVEKKYHLVDAYYSDFITLVLCFDKKNWNK